MKPVFFIPAASLITTGFCISNASSAYTPGVGFLELQEQAYRNQLTELNRRTSGCTLENVAVRKEW